MVNTEEGLWIGGAILLAVVYTPSVYFFTKFRDSPQVYNRSYLSVTTSVSGMTFYGILGCIASAVNGAGSCGGTVALQNLGLYLHFAFQIERCIVLIASYQIAVQAREYALKRHDQDLAVEVSRMQKKNPELQTLEKHESDDMGYLLKNRHLFQHSFKSPSKIAAFVSALAVWFIVIILVAVDPVGAQSARDTPACISLQGKISNINNAILAICVVLLLECARRISKVKENFMIKQELRNVGILAVVCLLWILTTTVVKPLKSFRPLIAFYIVVPLGEILFSFIKVVRLVRKDDKSERTRNDSGAGAGAGNYANRISVSTPSHRDQSPDGTATSVKVVAAHFGVDPPTPSAEAPSLASSSVTTTTASNNASKTVKKTKKSPQEKLRDVMNDEKLNAVFEQFMVQEFAIENVYFLRAVERFEKQFEVPMKDDEYQFAWDAARLIFVRFCAENAKLAVNISAVTQKQLAAVLANRSSASPNLNAPIDPDLFLRAKKEIIELVCMDSLRRFHNSPMYAAARPASSTAEV